MAFKLQDDQGYRVFGLEIQGLMTRFYMGANPFTASSLYDLSYTDLDCIQSITPYQAEIEPSGGVATYQPISISLAMDRMRGASIDPHVIFSRLSRSSSIWGGQLVANVLRSDNTPDLVVDSNPSISYPHLLHIGSESFYCTSQSESGGIYTITTTHRLGFRQQHQIYLGGTDTPIVSSELVSWRGRQAKIYACSVDQNGNTWDNQIIFQGIIESSPTIEGLNSVTISILPMTAMLDNKVSSGTQKTRLAQGVHYYGDIRNQLSPLVFRVPNFSAYGHYPLTLGSGLKTHDEIINTINDYGATFPSGPFAILKRSGRYVLRVSQTLGFDDALVFSDNSDLLIQASNEQFAFDVPLPYIAFDPQAHSFGISFLGSLAPVREKIDNRVYQSDLGLKFTVTEFPFGGADPALYDIRGFALGWRDRDEPYILVQDSLGLPTEADGNLYAIQIKIGEDVVNALATHEEDLGGAYLLHLDMTISENRRLPPFGDWLGEGSPIEISKGMIITRRPAGEVILQLLESGGGGAINGTYDLQLTGCNLNSSMIDEQSFLSLNSASGITDWMFSLPADELTLREILDPMLKTMGACIVMNRDSFNPRISLVLLGHEADEDQTALSDSDFLASKPPYWSNFEDIVTQFKFRYDMHQEEPTTRIVNNYDAINRLAGETKSMELDLYGITSDILGGTNASDFLENFLPTYARLFRLYGQAVRMWHLSIGTGKGLTLDVGSYLKITSAFLKGYTDAYGVSNKIAMVQSISIDLMGEGTELKLIHLGDSSPSWNASAKIATIVSTTTIEIEADFYSDADISYFKVGDIVDYVLQGSEATTLTKTIASISGNQITFTATHGMSSGGIIQPTTYLNAQSHHTKRAYIDRSFIYE
jgi:hypothetical protein